MKATFQNPYYCYASSYSFFFFITWSLWWSLYAIWLQNHIGLTKTQTGSLYAINQFTSIVFMVIYGIIQDRIGVRKTLMWVLSVVLVLTGPFFIYIYEPYLTTHFYSIVIIGSIFFGMGYLGGCGLVDSFTEKMSRLFRFEYGTSRLWGSLGYAIGAAIAGYVFTFNPHINFWSSSLVGLIFMLVNFLFKPSSTVEYNAEHSHKLTRRDFLALLRDKNFWIFVVFVIGTWTFYTIYDQQIFPVFYTTLFASKAIGTQVYGYLNSAQVLLEAIFMAIMPFFINHIGPKRALVLGSFIMLLRILATAFFTDPYIISCLKMLHALEVPLCVIAIFKYATTNFDERLSATIFLIGYQISSSIGIVFLSHPLGVLLDNYGYHRVFYLISAILVVMIVFAILMLSNKKVKAL